MGLIDNIRIRMASPEKAREILLSITDVEKDHSLIYACVKKYKPTLEDIKKNIRLLENHTITKIVANEINDDNFEEFIEYLDINTIIDLLNNEKITPKYELLEKYPKLKKIYTYSDKLIASGEYRAYRYARFDYQLSDAIEQGIFIPTLEDLEQHPNLCKLETPFLYVLNHSSHEQIDKIMSLCNVTRYIEKVYHAANSLGYKITFEKLKENPNLSNFNGFALEVINTLTDINDINEFVNLYGGDNDNVIDTIIDKGYVCSPEDIEKHPYFASNSTFFRKILNKSNCSLIKKYEGSNEEIFQLALDLGYKIKPNDIAKRRFNLRSLTYCKIAVDLKPKLFKSIYDASYRQTEILDYALSKKIVNPYEEPEFFEEIEKYPDRREILVKYFPKQVYKYSNEYDYRKLLCIAIENGLNISIEDTHALDPRYDADIIKEVLKKNPKYAIGMKDMDRYCIKVLTEQITNGKFVPSEEELKNLPSVVFKNFGFMKSIIELNPQYAKFTELSDQEAINIYKEFAKANKFLNLEYLRMVDKELVYMYFEHDSSLFDTIWNKLGLYTGINKIDFLNYALEKGFAPKNPSKYTSKYKTLYKIYNMDNSVYDSLKDDQKHMIDIMTGKTKDIDLALLKIENIDFDELFIKIVEHIPNAISLYNGSNPEVYKTAYEHGVEVKYIIELILFVKKHLEKYKILEFLNNPNIILINNINYGINYDTMASLEQEYPGLMEYFCEKGYISTSQKSMIDYILGKIDDFSEPDPNVNYSKLYYMHILDFDKPDVISSYKGEDIEVFEKAKNKGASIFVFLKILFYNDNSVEFKNKLIDLLGIDFLKNKGALIKEYTKTDYLSLIETLEVYPDFINYIDEKEKSFIDLIRGTKNIRNIDNYSGLTIENADQIIKYMEVNPNAIYAYSGDDCSVFKKGLELGIPKEILFNKGMNRYANPAFKSELFSVLEIKAPEKYINLLNSYTHNKYKFITNYQKYIDFISKTGIDIDKFEQYEFGKNYDWLSDILTISNDLENFLKVKDFFFEHFYKIKKYDTQLTRVNSLENILKNYVKYKDLCLDIVNKGLYKKDINNLLLLFGRSTISEFADGIPTKKEDLDSIDEQMLESYNKELISLQERPIKELIDFLCKILFDKNYTEVMSFIQTYGSTVNFRQLVFNGKNNKSLENLVYPIMVYTSMMESVLELNDKEAIISIIKDSLEDLKQNTDTLVIFRKIEDSIRTLFENDINYNLTDLSRMTNKEKYKDADLSTQYDVPVYNFSHVDYCLLAHVKSYSETIESLVKGIALSGQNNICLSAISYRNQIYFSNIGNRPIFAYGAIPNNSFCQSSVTNMGSNSALRANSSDVGEISRQQRGILETSESRSGGNNEYLCFREGLVPMGIILMGGKEPTQEEIGIAKEYNLPFIITQEYGKEIKNPEHAEMIPYEKVAEEKRREELTILRDKIIEYKRSKRRQIAIFTDIHGLFEPALAILEDARKRGITEIYSLGDNVGTGPNPKEVINLLNEYGVRSIKGNHEGYANDISQYEEHLIQAGALEEARGNSQYTRGKLSEEELTYIEGLPEDYTIEIGGKKILLTHYTKDYNTGKDRYDLSTYDEVFQGHVHFGSKQDNVTTLKGVAIGSDSDIPSPYEPMASYVVLTETDDGYEVEKVNVPYNYRESYFDVLESDLSDRDKDKIERWGRLK